MISITIAGHNCALMWKRTFVDTRIIHDRLMYRSQHRGIQHVGSGDEDTLVSEIVAEVLLRPDGILTKYRADRDVELNLVDFLFPQQQSETADEV